VHCRPHSAAALTIIVLAAALTVTALAAAALVAAVHTYTALTDDAVTAVLLAAALAAAILTDVLPAYPPPRPPPLPGCKTGGGIHRGSSSILGSE